MNQLLQLKGQFESRNNKNRPGPATLPKGKMVSVGHLKQIRNDLINAQLFWKDETLIDTPILSVYYTEVIAKSNRIKKLLYVNGHNLNDYIVGAKFTKGERRKHIMTYCLEKDSIQRSIDQLDECIDIVETKFNGCLSAEDLNKVNKNKIKLKYNSLSKTSFGQLIVDAFYVEKIKVDMYEEDFNENSIISLYKTSKGIEEIMRKLNIHYNPANILNETTLLLDKSQLAILKDKAPYLIAMGLTDMGELEKEDVINSSENDMNIERPDNEPIIGVIDTLFDTQVYFHEWVDEHNDLISQDIPKSTEDYFHGTEVCSIIVDGPSLNPELDDQCGHFRVRHFGVALHGKFSSFSIIKNIQRIVESNQDIKVWNLSLGSILPVSENYISFEGSVLDELQNKYDIIFVVSGTNNNNNDRTYPLVGAPADSINSVVVNAVDFDGKIADYSRSGPILSFYNKPDISYYGGTKENPLVVCNSYQKRYVSGTSFAAPWISRKLAYMIYELGFSREVAKALLIDSATSWTKSDVSSCLIGYGVVPIKISDIVSSKDDEIKFVLSGVSDKYETYNSRIPVPVYKDKQPFIAKATMCYYPHCNRNQGVDYTDTELDIHFGRINDKGKILTVNNNYQDEDTLDYDKLDYLKEENSRKLYRKWDNIKHIVELLKSKPRGKKVYGKGYWGISIKSKERLVQRKDNSIPFGLVVTLKEINGVNRIDDFIYMCSFSNWIVNRVDIDNLLDVYNKAEEEIEWE